VRRELKVVMSPYSLTKKVTMRSILYLFSILPLLLLFNQNGFAQQRNCGTMEVLDRLLEEDPQMQFRMERIEQLTQRYLERGIDFRAEVVKIPVVVHIVYENSTENISDAQVQSQIDVLNEDFRRTNLDADNTWSQAADTQVEFCLASVDPNGNPTSGITRTITSVTSFGTNDEVKFSSSGGKDAWPAGDYLNIWVCDISSGILGYAQFPGGDPATDGVVNDYLYFGRGGSAEAPFDLGRTATHEVGHWLNLRHIWGDGPCRWDDYVTDTPDSDNPNYGCNVGHVSCRSTDMVQNYMDYSDDACMNLFTQGQSGRMNALFASGGARESLLSSPAACGGSPAAEICDDGIDNDGDGLTDCDDPDCDSDTACQPVAEVCDDGIDNDGDGLTDCDDPDCDSDTACQPVAEICDDGIDNDGDGAVDCADADCDSDTACQPAEECTAPNGLVEKITKGGRQAELTWNAVSGASSYTVTFTDLSTSTSTIDTYTGTTAVYPDLTRGNSYEWCVAANCSTGQSTGSCQTFISSPGNREAQRTSTSMSVYPNPARDMITVEFDDRSIENTSALDASSTPDQRTFLYLIDLTGRVIAQHQLLAGETRTELSVAGMAEGLYMIKLTDAEGKLKQAGKVIISH